VDVDDNARRDSGQLPSEEHERSLLPALCGNGVRPKAAELTRDAEREERVERGAVEHAGPHGANEPEARIRPLAAGGARKHAHVELRGERVELPRERGGKRERVAGAPHHQQLPSHS